MEQVNITSPTRVCMCACVLGCLCACVPMCSSHTPFASMCLSTRKCAVAYLCACYFQRVCPCLHVRACAYVDGGNKPPLKGVKEVDFLMRKTQKG